MMTLEIRVSTLALRSASTSDRTVGGASKNCPITPPGSISWRSPPTCRTSVELLLDLRLAADEQRRGDQARRRNRHGENDEHEDDPDAAPDCHVVPPGVEYSWTARGRADLRAPRVEEFVQGNGMTFGQLAAQVLLRRVNESPNRSRSILQLWPHQVEPQPRKSRHSHNFHG